MLSDSGTCFSEAKYEQVLKIYLGVKIQLYAKLEGMPTKNIKLVILSVFSKK